jgi:uncharacterized protein (DUF302 family)
MAYNYSKKLRRPFDEVVRKITENLLEHGFTIINVMDFKKSLKSSLKVDFRNYTILSTCHTLLSYKAISLEPHSGVLLPCNIVVQEHENGEVEVSALNPLETLDQNMVTPSLEIVAIEISNHLRTAIDSLRVKTESFSFSYN